MKIRFFTIVFFLTFITGVLLADSGVLAYVEGRVTLERAGSGQQNAVIGDTVRTGDTLYTAADSFAEITLESGSTVSIEEGSVFNIGEVADPEAKSRKRGFFRVLLGSVKFKFRNLTREPDVGTPLAVCSVRGTDFTVYTAPDGASMTIVSDGLVEVSSGGESALLSADEGIEVVAGLGLGEPFDVRKGIIRYDAFVKQALTRFDDDPSAAIKAYTEQLLEYIEEGEFYLKSFETNMGELISVRSKVPEIRSREGDEAANKYMAEKLGPLQDRGFELNSTYRFHFISAFFMRRYVISSIYVRMRTRYLTDRDNPDWIDFSKAYMEFTNLYEQRLIPLLEVEDL